MQTITFILFLLTTNVYYISCQDWNYDVLGPDMWSVFYPTCAGHFQSPINIKTACTVYQTLTPFQFSADYNRTYNFTIYPFENNYRVLYNNSNPSPSFTLTGGGLNGTFQLVSFHLHWGENFKSGSEHQM